LLVKEYSFNLESNLFDLHDRLKKNHYLPKPLKVFKIFVPKERYISVSCFEDRIVHHALILQIGPIMERSMVYHSYANRKGKGSHAAMKAFADNAKKYMYILKCDIRKYFPSIDHTVLLQKIKAKIKCKKSVELIENILAVEYENKINDVLNFELPCPESKKGLPIGNLTSQWFANFYLSDFDHYIQDQNSCKAYLRYVDDFIIFSNTKSELNNLKEKIKDYLFEKERLVIHTNKSKVYTIKQGVPFLGFLHFRFYRKLLGINLRNFKRRTKRRLKDLNLACSLSIKIFNQSITSWMAHAAHGHTYTLRNNIYKSIYENGDFLYR
jgi:RNA-directed DNA polymerase